MNSIWRSSSAWLRRARLTNMSPMPLRSSEACSVATSTATCWIEVTAWPRWLELGATAGLDVGDRLGHELDVVLGRVAQRLDEAGQLLGGDLVDGLGEAGQRAGDRGGHDAGQHDRDERDADAEHEEELRRSARRVELGLGRRQQAGGLGRLDGPEHVELEPAGSSVLDRVGRERLAEGGVGGLRRVRSRSGRTRSRTAGCGAACGRPPRRRRCTTASCTSVAATASL